MNQLETTLEALKERSSDAVGAVQHGVEAIGTRLGVIEPPRRRSRTPWLVVLVVAAAASVVWWQVRTRRTADDATTDETGATAPTSRSA